MRRSCCYAPKLPADLQLRRLTSGTCCCWPWLTGCQPAGVTKTQVQLDMLQWCKAVQTACLSRQGVDVGQACQQTSGALPR